MRSLFRTLRPYLTPSYIISAAAVIAAVAVLITYAMLFRKPQATFATVMRGDIAQEVDATGSVTPTETVDLGFQRGGTIQSIDTDVGRTVAAGQTLATLSSADLVAQLHLAQSNLAAQQAKLDELTAGTRPEELATSRNAVAQAINSSYIAADSAVHDTVDQFVSNPKTPTPTLTFTTTNSSLVQPFLAQRVEMEATVAALDSLTTSGDASSETGLVTQAQQATQDLLAVQSFLDAASTLLSAAISSQNVSAATLQSYESAVAAARSSVSTALSALTAAQGKLSLEEAGSTSQDIEAQQAAVAGAQAQIDSINAELAQAIVRAPINGTVTRQDGHEGQVVSQGQAFISLISNARFEIQAQVSEADIGKIAVGNPVIVRLDAYPNDTFDAAIVSVDPAATMQSGAPSYKVTAQFTVDDAHIKSGLTANLAIETGKAESALEVPQSAVIIQGSQTFVLKQGGSGQTLVPVQVGIEGGGMAQILGGLAAGDRVASFGNAQ